MKHNRKIYMQIDNHKLKIICRTKTCNADAFISDEDAERFVNRIVELLNKKRRMLDRPLNIGECVGIINDASKTIESTFSSFKIKVKTKSDLAIIKTYKNEYEICEYRNAEI